MTSDLYAVLSMPCPHEGCDERMDVDFDADEIEDSPVTLLFDCEECQRPIEVELELTMKAVR